MAHGLGGSRKGAALGVIGQLRDPARRHEAGQLDAAQARVGEHPGELQLVVRGDEGRLVLEAVPEADLVDLDPIIQGHHAP